MMSVDSSTPYQETECSPLYIFFVYNISVMETRILFYSDGLGGISGPPIHSQQMTPFIAQPVKDYHHSQRLSEMSLDEEDALFGLSS